MRASGTQQHRRRQHPDRVKYDRAVERLRQEMAIVDIIDTTGGRLDVANAVQSTTRNVGESMSNELTLEQMLIELQQRWSAVELYSTVAGWQIELGAGHFIWTGRTPHAAVIQAFREGQHDKTA